MAGRGVPRPDPYFLRRALAANGGGAGTARGEGAARQGEAQIGRAAGDGPRALCISFHAHLPTINVLFSGKAQNRLADRLETGIKAHIFAVYPAWRQDPVMQIALSYSIHGAYWAYTKNQNVDEAQLLDVIGRLAGALRALY